MCCFSSCFSRLSFSFQLQCVHVLHMLCVCDSVCDVCGAGLGGGGGDGGGGARLELFPPSMQPESFWKGKRSVYK